MISECHSVHTHLDWGDLDDWLIVVMRAGGLKEIVSNQTVDKIEMKEHEFLGHSRMNMLCVMCFVQDKTGHNPQT